MINIKIHKKDLWLLSAIVVFLVGVGYVIAYHSGASPSVMGHSAEELEVEIGGNTYTLQYAITNNLLGGGSCSLGNRILLSNGTVQTFIQQAATDGFVNAYSYDENMWIYSDSNNPPTTLIAYDDLYHSGSSSNIMVVVKKGDYFKVYVTGGNSKIDKIYWIPLNCGSGGGGVQMKTGNYTGNGSDNRNINIGIDLASATYKWLVIKDEDGRKATHKFGHETGDFSDYFTTDNQEPDRIQAWTQNGFQVGASENVEPLTYNYVVFYQL